MMERGEKSRMNQNARQDTDLVAAELCQPRSGQKKAIQRSPPNEAAKRKK